MASSSTSVGASLKGKRKKAIPANANPLFTKWLTEWKDEAIQKGWKSQYNYSKALRTLKAFPLRLETGKDCKLLQNFGDKMCKMLDEKLAEYRVNQEKGDEDEDSQPSTSVPSQSSQSQHHANPRSTASTTLHAISDNSDSGREETASPRKKRKKKSPGTRLREYVPAYRSGPYAIVLIMYRHSLNPDYKGYFTKTELMHAAQPLADKSFFIVTSYECNSAVCHQPDPGSHYTAWASMGSLIKRRLIIKDSNPARYYLTQEGSELGERLERAENGESNSQTESACNATDKSGESDKQNSALTSPLTTGMNLDNLDDLNLTAEEKAFILGGISNDVNRCSSSSSAAPVPKIVDDPVFVLSEDEEDIISCSLWRNPVPSKQPKAHCVSPSLSPPSSPSITTPSVKPLDNPDVLNDCENNIDDYNYFMDLDDIEVCDDDDVNITHESQQSPLERLRLPSLSPPPTFSPLESHNINCSTQSKTEFISKEAFTNNGLSNYDDGVIEIDDNEDDDDNNNKFNTKSPKKNIFHKVHNQFSQSSDGDEGHKKSIFNKFDHQISQNSQSDDDDLPDLDFGVPLSKRLFNKGAVSSQVLNDFNIDLTVEETEEVCSVHTIQNAIDSPSKQYSSPVKTVMLDDIIHEPSKPFTSITTKVKDVNNTQKINTVCDVAQPLFPTLASGSISNSEGAEIALESRPVPKFTLLPGSFDIILCIDNREFYGSKSNSKTLLPDLMQSGINCDLRLLHIGDLLWVAREKGRPNEAIPRDDRKELVLNFAIERKRMDDLVSSITGGRLKEQKFRLRHCGLSELIILIEEYGSIQNFSLSEDRIKQSIVNSQILDGFKVKRCGSSKEAVMYLSMMTRFIQKYYGNKTLHAAPQEYVKARAPKSTIKDHEHFLMPFETFNEASIKHKTLPVKEMFGKQLMQIPGVSLERASAITKVYPSLTSLLKSYENCTTEKSRESLLASIKCGNKERNLGIAVSRMVCMLYNTMKLS